MKSATLKDIKTELANCSPNVLVELCLRMSKFKKDNKELLTYLLFEANDEAAYIKSIKNEIDLQFTLINKKNFYYIKKSIRKILSMTKKNIRYSQKKETEVELLIYFCQKLISFKPSIRRNIAMTNLFNRQLSIIKKSFLSLHEDLQYDFKEEIESLSLN